MRFKIFKIPRDSDKDKADSNFVGFYLDAMTDDTLRLLSLDLRKSRSGIIKEIIEKWLHKNKVVPDQLIGNIADRGYLIFKANYESVTTFRKDFKEELKGKKVPAEMISRIITKIDEKIKHTNEEERS